ncbi:gamma carbonic anhydrase family protein [Wolbachia endosymbiont of Chironomus riparius]|uniref:gamma carbonic anhydrase family protein n=1 Tax=Wolbachia endosymbiont of Chironomus riparius TaxID=2883238 RepID=UPI00209CDCC7|nr:gamma carbonic anhydrase family protein [Wolbachia endosymbiont of Chironomus riparius]
MYHVLKYEGYVPKIDNSAFIAGGSYIIGKVEIGKDSSIWFNCVLRGDVGSITIGNETNIQDGTVIHVDRNVGGDTIIGNMVTVGHFCVLHACKIHDKAFVGMSSTIMDHAIVEPEAMVAAGSLVTAGKVVKSGEIWAGRPAKFFKKMAKEEIKHIEESAKNYVLLMKDYILQSY